MSQAGPQANGPASPSGKYIDGVDREDPEYIKNLQRPAEVKEDLQQMENRSRVKLVLNSQAFKEELEAVVEEQLQNGPYPAGLIALQQITDLLMPNAKGTYGGLARAASVIPINDLRGVESLGFAKGEKLLRCKLAALYRIVDLCGWSHGIFNHISARVGSENEHFLVNPFGVMYSEVTASSLVKVDVLGDTVDQGSSQFGVSKPSFALHSAIHQARPDIKCVVHLHNPASVAVSAMKCGLLPVSQEALICGKVSYHDYQGVLTDPEERDKLARNLGVHNKVMVIRNNGIVACGESVEEAFHFTFNVMAACESQIKLMPAGLDNIVIPSEEAQEQAFKVANSGGGGVESTGRKWKTGELEFEALMRTLDNSGYRTGYVFKMPIVKQEKRERSTNEVEIPPSSSSFTYVFDGDYEHSKYASPIKAAMERHKKAFKAGWLTTPNTYKKQELEEIGTTTPKKITKWVPENDAANRPSGTPIKIENANQFAPQGTNPKEFKQKQKSIKKDYYEEKVSAGPQSKILDGLSWDEAQRAKDGQLSSAGDQLIVVGAASKGIIQRDHQHNAVVFRQYYAANPFENMSEAEIEAYQDEVQRKERGEPEPPVVQFEPEPEPEPEPVIVQKQPEPQPEPELIRQQIIEAEAPKRSGGVNGVSDPRASASASPGPRGDEALAQLADRVVQAVIRDSLAIVCQGKGQQALARGDPMHYQHYFFSLLLGSQMLLAYRTQIGSSEQQGNSEEDQFSSENESILDSEDKGVENENYCTERQSSLKKGKSVEDADCSERSGVFESLKLKSRPKERCQAPSGLIVPEAVGAATGEGGQLEAGASDQSSDFVTVQMNPITLYHGQAEAGVMKVRFSIMSRVRRKVTMDPSTTISSAANSSIEEVYAAVSEPLVQHFEADCQQLGPKTVPATTDSRNETFIEQVCVRKRKSRHKENVDSNVQAETDTMKQHFEKPEVAIQEEMQLPQVEPPARCTIEAMRPTMKLTSSHSLNKSTLIMPKTYNHLQNFDSIHEETLLHQVDPPAVSTIVLQRPSITLPVSCNDKTVALKQSKPTTQFERSGHSMSAHNNNNNICQSPTGTKSPANLVFQDQGKSKEFSILPQQHDIAVQKRQSDISKEAPIGTKPHLNLPKVNIFTPLALSKLSTENTKKELSGPPRPLEQNKSRPSELVLKETYGIDSIGDIPFADDGSSDEEDFEMYSEVSHPPMHTRKKELARNNPIARTCRRQMPPPPPPPSRRPRFVKSKKRQKRRLNRHGIPLSPVKEEFGDSLEEMEEMAAIYEDADDSFEQLLASAADSLLVSPKGTSSSNDYKLDLQAFIGAAPLATEDNTEDLDELVQHASHTAKERPCSDLKDSNLQTSPHTVLDIHRAEHSATKVEEKNNHHDFLQQNSSEESDENSSDGKEGSVSDADIDESDAQESDRYEPENMSNRQDILAKKLGNVQYSQKVNDKQGKDFQDTDDNHFQLVNSVPILPDYGFGYQEKKETNIDDLDKDLMHKKINGVEKNTNNQNQLLSHSIDINLDDIGEFHQLKQNETQKLHTFGTDVSRKREGDCESFLTPNYVNDGMTGAVLKEKRSLGSLSEGPLQTSSPKLLRAKSSGLGLEGYIQKEESKPALLDNMSQEYHNAQLLMQPEATFSSTDNNNNAEKEHVSILATETASDPETVEGERLSTRYPEETTLRHTFPGKDLSGSAKETVIDDIYCEPTSDDPGLNCVVSNKNKMIGDGLHVEEPTRKKETLIDEALFEEQPSLSDTRKQYSKNTAIDDACFNKAPRMTIPCKKETLIDDGYPEMAATFNSDNPLHGTRNKLYIDTSAASQMSVGWQGKESPKLMHLDEYHLRKHNEMMELPSSRSVFKTPSTPPALVVFPLTSDGLPPLPDTTEVPSISDTEGRQRLERQLRHERAQTRQDCNQGSRPDYASNVVTAHSLASSSLAEGSNASSKKWVPKRNRERRRLRQHSDGGEPEIEHASQLRRGPDNDWPENRLQRNRRRESQGLPRSGPNVNKLKTEQADKVIDELKHVQSQRDSRKQPSSSCKEDSKPLPGYAEEDDTIVEDPRPSKLGKEVDEREPLHHSRKKHHKETRSKDDDQDDVRNEAKENQFRSKKGRGDQEHLKDSERGIDGYQKRQRENEDSWEDSMEKDEKNQRRHRNSKHRYGGRGMDDDDRKRPREYEDRWENDKERKEENQRRPINSKHRYGDRDMDDDDDDRKRQREYGDRREDDKERNEENQRRHRNSKHRYRDRDVDGDGKKRERENENSWEDNQERNEENQRIPRKSKHRYEDRDVDDARDKDRKRRERVYEGTEKADFEDKGTDADEERYRDKNHRRRKHGKDNFKDRDAEDNWRKNERGRGEEYKNKYRDKGVPSENQAGIGGYKEANNSRGLDENLNSGERDRTKWKVNDSEDFKSSVPAIHVTPKTEPTEDYSSEVDQAMQAEVVAVDRFLNSVPDIDRRGSPRLSKRRGGAIAPSDSSEKRKTEQRASRANSEPKGNRSSLGLPNTSKGHGRMSSPHMAALARSNTSLASSTHSRRSRSASPRVFENSPEDLPPKPQIDPLTGEPFFFVHPLMDQSMESLPSIGTGPDSGKHSTENMQKTRDYSPNRHNKNAELKLESEQEERLQGDIRMHAWDDPLAEKFKQDGAAVLPRISTRKPKEDKNAQRKQNQDHELAVHEKPIMPIEAKKEYVRDLKEKELSKDSAHPVIKNTKQEVTIPKSRKHSQKDEKGLQDAQKSNREEKAAKKTGITHSDETLPKTGKVRRGDKTHLNERTSRGEFQNDELEAEAITRWQPGPRRQSRRGVWRAVDTESVDSASEKRDRPAQNEGKRDSGGQHHALDRSNEDPILSEDPVDLTLGHEDLNLGEEEPPHAVPKNKKGIFSRLSCVGGKSKESVKQAEKVKGKSPISKPVAYYEEGEKNKIRKVSKEKDKEEKSLWYFQKEDDLPVDSSSDSTKPPDGIVFDTNEGTGGIFHDAYPHRRSDKRPHESDGQRSLSTFVNPITAIDSLLEDKSTISDPESLQKWTGGRMTPVIEESSVSSFRSSKKEESEFSTFKHFSKQEEIESRDPKLETKLSNKKRGDDNNNTDCEASEKIFTSPFKLQEDEKVQPKRWEPRRNRSQTTSWKPKETYPSDDTVLSPDEDAQALILVSDNAIQKRLCDPHLDRQDVTTDGRSPNEKYKIDGGKSEKIEPLSNFSSLSNVDTNKDPESHNPDTVHERLDSSDELDTANWNSSSPADFDPSHSVALTHKNVFGPAYNAGDRTLQSTDASFEPSASFDSADVPLRCKNRALSFDDSYNRPMAKQLFDPELLQDAAMGRKRRVSVASTESSSLRGGRSRSSSTTSNPLSYEPWRAKAKRRSRSMSISEMMFARGAPRPFPHPPRSRSRSIGEIPHAYSSTVSSSVARRRSRTQSPQELSPRMYQPRQRSRSRASLGDTSLGCVAAPDNQHSSGYQDSGPHPPSDASALLAENDGYIAAAPVKRSESERQPVRLAEDSERRNVERSKSDRRQQLIEQNPTSPSKSDTLRSTDSASGGETLEERSSKEGSPTKEHPSPTKEKKKKKKFRIPSFSKKKNKESKESAI